MTPDSNPGGCKKARMFLPPPVRWTVPLLVLVFGLTATWLDYWLALDVNLGRDLSAVRGRAEGLVRRLAVVSEGLLDRGDVKALRLNLQTMMDVPELVLAAVVDEQGVILADSDDEWSGRQSSETPLAEAARLIRPMSGSAVEHAENAEFVFAACPFQLHGTDDDKGWTLVTLDRRPAMKAAMHDARVQLGWIAGAMVLLSFALWAVLHFIYANRLAALAAGIRQWDMADGAPLILPRGADEVGTLAAGFLEMTERVRRHEDEQIRLEREVLNVSDDERRRIGHDLHDGLGQRLTAALMAVQAMLESLRGSAPGLVGHGELVARQLRDAITETRALSHGLAPVGMEADGLLAALKEMAESISRSGRVRCVLECPHPVPLDDVTIGGHIFRIAQEAANNALKHASPSEIRIGLEWRDDELVLEIEDDGPGMAEGAADTEGLGMRVMRYRARLIGGDLDVSTAPAGGTLIRCVVDRKQQS
ncbi:MAG: sensor histidine kinase [Prosthecobacter sp.]